VRSKTDLERCTYQLLIVLHNNIDIFHSVNVTLCVACMIQILCSYYANIFLILLGSVKCGMIIDRQSDWNHHEKWYSHIGK